MGVSRNRVTRSESQADGTLWWCMTSGQAGVDHHGCSLGRCDETYAGAEDTEVRVAKAFLAAVSSQADLDAFMATLTTAPASGPWVGIVPATWWAGRWASERGEFRATIRRDVGRALRT